MALAKERAKQVMESRKRAKKVREHDADRLEKKTKTKRKKKQ